MFKIKIIVSLLFSCAVYSHVTDTLSEGIPSRKEILNLANEASDLLHESNYEKSFTSSRLALYYAIAIKDYYLIAKSYNIIGANYEKLSEYDKGILFYKKGLKYANLAKNDTVKNWINNNLGNIYCFEKKDYKTGISYYNKSLLFNQQNKDTTSIVLTKLNIAWAYFEVNQFEKGKTYLEFVNSHSAKYGNPSDLVILYMADSSYKCNFFLIC